MKSRLLFLLLALCAITAVVRSQPVTSFSRSITQNFPAGTAVNQVLVWNGDYWVPGTVTAGAAAVAASTNIVASTNGQGVISIALADPTTVGGLNVNNGVVTNLYANLLNSTNLVDTNIIATISTFPSQTNAVTLNNGEWLLQSSGPVSLTNVVGQVAGQRTWALIQVSNTGGSSFTNFCTIPNARYLGSSSTNALTIPSGKVGQWLVEVWGAAGTNVFSCVQQ